MLELADKVFKAAAVPALYSKGQQRHRKFKKMHIQFLKTETTKCEIKTHWKGLMAD